MDTSSEISPSPEEVLFSTLSRVEAVRNLPRTDAGYVERAQVLAEAVATGACVKDTFNPGPDSKPVGFRAEPIVAATTRANEMLAHTGTASLPDAISEIATAVELLLSRPGLSTQVRDWLYSAGGAPRAITELDVLLANWLSETAISARFNSVVDEGRWPPASLPPRK